VSARSRTLALLTLLAAVFTIGLTFASIELPRLLDTLIMKNVDTPDVATGQDAQSARRTDLYLRHFRLRLIGYVCLALIVLMIAVGFITEKSGWPSAGAVLLFLPVFGHFAAAMFFLGGLGFLRLLWMPFLDVSFDLFRLGAIVNWPFKILFDLYALTGLGRWIRFSYVVTGLGLFIFFLGTLTWFYARAQKKGVADFWIYRLSRHPQYLGWIIWSYGVMFLPGSNIKLNFELSNTLPWLLSTMIIIGIAMLEEMKMARAHGESYEAYRRRAPFLFPLPRFITKPFNIPLRLMFKKPYPERKREIAAVLAFYTVFLLGISAFYGGLVAWPGRKVGAPERRVAELVRILKDADNRGEKRQAADQLSRMGEQAVEPLLLLLEDKDSNVRGYSAGALGGLKSERALAPLISLLHDEDRYVRQSAAGALGSIGSVQAVPPLAEALQDRQRGIAVAAAGALGQINHPDVVPLLIGVLQDPGTNAMGAAAGALAALGAKEAIEPLIRCFEEMENCPYDAVGTALWTLGSDRAVDAWIIGLKKASFWYPRTVCAASLAKYKLDKGIPALLEALKDESKEVRRAAVLALMEFRSATAIPALRKALTDEDLEVRIYAAEALKTIGNAK